MLNDKVARSLILLLALLTLWGMAARSTPLPAAAQEAPSPTAIHIVYEGSWNSEARAALEYAATLWETFIDSSVPITVQARWQSLPSGVPAEGGVQSYSLGFAGAPDANVWYPAALRNAITGTDLVADAEVVVVFNQDIPNWYFGIDGRPASRQYDFVTLAMQQIGRGLGLETSLSHQCPTPGNKGCWGYQNDHPTVFDRFLVNRAGNRLIDTTLYPNPSISLGNQLASGNIFFDGPQARVANGGLPPKLYAPATWQEGASLVYLDEAAYATVSSEALMTPVIHPGEAHHYPGPVFLAMLEDLGWQLRHTAPRFRPLSTQLLGTNTRRDEAIDLWQYVTDLQSSPADLIFSISNSPHPSAGVGLVDGRYIEIHPLAEWTGETTVRVTAVDPQGLASSRAFKVVVTSQIYRTYLPVALQTSP